MNETRREPGRQRTRYRRSSVAGIVLSGLVLTIVAAPDARAQTTAPAKPVTCASSINQRQVCAADTSSGVVLVKTTGTVACLLGMTWGYDSAGIWVKDGCAGEFMVGGSSTQAPLMSSSQSQPERSSYSAFDASGTGFLVGKSDRGELRIGGYALVRYVNQLPADQTFTDHLGNVRVVDTRNDIQFHRAMLHFRGWLLSPKFRYQITSWTVMSTDQTTLYGFLGYQFHKVFNLYAGTNGIGGSRSLYGSHPFWLANDRVMADELFRGGFTNGVWANGEVAPGLWYSATVGNNFSQLGIGAKQLDRGLATGGSIWWMPTTQEFGPNGSYSDWEYHEKVATRFGMSTARSRENRQELEDKRPENTQTRMADSVALFDTGALAPGVTVSAADLRLLSLDAALKYRGIFLQTEVFSRWIDHIDVDGPLPIGQVLDTGFYIQGAFFPIRKRLEVYGATSQVFGDKDAGYGNSHEYLGGANFYWFQTRDIRTNVQFMRVDRSPASSVFGFYVGGQKGHTISIATSFYF